MAAPTSNLDTIKQKVRRLTRTPSTAMLSDNDLEQYINTFVVYDFPEHLRTFNLRTQYTFYTNPGQDVYPTDILSFGGAVQAEANPLYDFQNIYLTIHDPVYIAGFPAVYSQSRQQFFGLYPIVNSISSIGVVGNNATTRFTGVINSQQALIPSGFTQQICLLQNNVLFSSVDLNGNGLAMRDVPYLDSVTGMPTVYGQLRRPNDLPAAPVLINAPYVLGNGVGQVNPDNYINYATGQFVVDFDNAPGMGQPINSQTVPQQKGLPQSLLFYANQFTVRPVPDQPYRVDFEVFKRPSALLASSQEPTLNEYWQYIAYGAAIKVMQDKQDIESVNLMMPEFKKQETLVNRRTIVQNTNQRTATIYTEQTGYGPGSGFWGSGTF